ncbi:hypothetical protein G6O69_00325 [Pseudenhygromyxa sp. WMMC2535]|uniref:hypothetical protein n=1 Tax=Pseudenhygromyxa sp. WMMC2535 TaxID=2712867 RepID=UPI001555CE3E|nr:hypothetical protein [Pseudenhygromyxa sp. WMMC2535]NVB36255.1 hypothetical protein [Pseudenhygromyxa sp. WMMC2535]
MELDETGLSALANFAEAAVAAPRDFERIAQATVSDARRFDSAANSSALTAAIEAIGATLTKLERDPAARTVDTMMLTARRLRERDDQLAQEAGRAIVWALENQLLLAARRDADPLPSGVHDVDRGPERSRPVPIRSLEG